MEKKLQRNEQDKILAGVCSGLAEYFDVDVTWIRVAFAVAVLAGLSGILAYIVLWIAVPAKPFVPGNFQTPYNKGAYGTDYRVYEDRNDPNYYNNAYTTPEFPVQAKKSGNGRMIVGLIMVGFGAFFLLDEFNVIPYWFDFDKLWPLVFIIPGILIISKNGKPKNRNSDQKVTASEFGAGSTANAPGSTVEENKL